MYRYKSYKATPNANHIKRASPVPPPHACKCYKCGKLYQGYGRICPDCLDTQAEEREIECMTANAILETRERAAREAAHSTFTNVGKNANEGAK